MNNTIKFLSEGNSFLITCHVNADGDAYASALAMSQLLTKMGKKTTVIIPDSIIEPRYSFMGHYDRIITWSDDLNLEPFEAAIICDAPGIRRIGNVEKFLPPYEKRLKIDHHPQEDDVAMFNFEDDSASSTAKLVYQLCLALGDHMDKDIAACIYAGISYDTGRFTYSNCGWEDYLIASELMKYRIDNYEINRHIFLDNRAEAVRVIGYGLQNLEQYEEGKISLISLPYNLVKDVSLSDIDDLSLYSVSIEGTRVGVFIREIAPGKYKISLRAVDDTPVNQIAAVFNGGGHRKAAGCRFEGQLQQFKHQLISAIKSKL